MSHLVKSAGLKTCFVFLPLARSGKNWIQISFVNCFAIPNRRLLSRKTEFEFVRPYDLIPKYRAFYEARPAEGGASEQQNNPDFEKSLSWSGHWELNPVYTHPKRVYYRYTMACRNFRFAISDFRF